MIRRRAVKKEGVMTRIMTMTPAVLPTLMKLKTLQLQSVMRGRNGGTAIISDNLLTVGQEIEGFTVEKIQAKSVILIWRDKKFVLEMP